jgi:hypothetical protein
VTESAIAVKGSGNLEYATLRDVYVNNTVDITLTDLGGSVLASCTNDFGGKAKYVQAAAIQSFHFQTGCLFDIITTAWTSALITNFMFVKVLSPLNDFNDGFSSLVGNGSSVFAPGGSQSLVMPDAAASLGFGATVAGTLIGVNSARNTIRCTPTAARVLTIAKPQGVTTEIIIQNQGNFPIDLTFSGVAAQAVGNPTYVPPQSQLEMVFPNFGGTALWCIRPIVQAGTVALTNGVSALIPADITASSRITATLKTFSGAAGIPGALSADRVVGTRVGGGGFKITSYLLATGAVVATDQGTYDWHVDNQGG